MKRAIRSILFIFVFTAGMVGAQNTSRLQNQLQENKRQIDLAREVLSETLAEKKATLKTISAYKSQIALQEEALLDMSLRMNELEIEIEEAKEEISGITAEIKRLREDFSEALVKGYKNSKRMSKLHFVFMSNSFNQLLKRMEYLERVLEFRKLQLALIEEKLIENSTKINELNARYDNLENLHTERESETEALKKDQELYDGLVIKLKNKEVQLREELKKRDELNQELEKTIREEIKKSEERIERRRVETAAVSGFVRGGLPWPVNNGYISESFGRHKHHDFKNVTTQNNGINIVCRANSEISCVFEGVVSAVMEVPGMQTTVLVKHGKYYSVYANLARSNVSGGQELKQGEAIGVVGLNESGIPELHLEIWEGSTKLNPSLWIRK